MAAPKKPTTFDLKVFEKMSPPIRIRIERKNSRNGLMEPIPLPQDVWSKEDAERIEQIVLNDVAGGGHYKAQMTDSNGLVLEWSFAFPTDFFPSLVPPGSAPALGHAPATVVPQIGGQHQAAPQIVPPALPWSRGMYGTPVTPPAGTFVPSYQGQPSPMPQQPMMPPSWFYPPPPPAPMSTPMSPPRDRERDHELVAMRQQLAEQRRQADEERHAREREAAEARHREETRTQQAQFAEEMRQLRATMAESKRPAGDTPEMQMLKAQLDAQQKQADEQRRQFETLQAESTRRLEAQQAEQRHQETLRAMQDAQQREMQTMRDLIAKASENKGPDPQMTLLIEMQRQQMESAREQSRSQMEQAREASRLAAEQPRTMVEMMEKLRNASGSDQLLANMSTSWMGLMEQQRGVLEMVMSMGPDPKMALAEGALAGGKEILERYVSAKRDEALASQRTQQVQAQATTTQAAYAAQWQHPQPTAQAPFRNADGSIEVPPPTRDQLQGSPAEDEEPEDDTEEMTEADIFGPLEADIDRLRAAVAEDVAKPEHVAQAIIEAAMVIDQDDLQVPVFSLFAEQRYAELIDLLLPDVSPEFAAETINELSKRLADFGLETMAEPKARSVALKDDVAEGSSNGNGRPQPS